MTLPIQRAFVELPFGQMHVARCGDRAAPAVLLLHQTPRSWREYRAVLPLLGDRWHAIAPDTPGFGDSAPLPGPAGIEGWAVAMGALMDALGLAQAHVVGHHTGGVIALEMAAAFPARVASLVLSSTPFTSEAFRLARRDRPPIDAVAPSTDGSHLAALWQRRQGFYPTDRPDLLEAFVCDAMKVSGDVESGHRAVGAYRMEERIGHVRQPVLLMHAGADPFAAPHLPELQAHLPQAQVAGLPDGMVPLPDQLPQPFAAALRLFLAALG